MTLAPDEEIRFKVKAELRKRMRGLRKTTPIEACAARAEKIVTALEALDVVKAAKTVASFWPMLDRHEIDLRPFDAALRARGVRVAYPTIDPEVGSMTFHWVDDVTTLAEAGNGFEEPPADAPAVDPATLDVIIVPAIAIDPVGFRIGYGAGYYDRALPNYPAATSIAVGYDWQLVAEVPTTEGDVAVSWVVTDMRVIDATRARRST